MFFKSDVKPEWEDSKNKNGGKWVVTIEKSQYKDVPIQALWEETMIGLIGCQFDEMADINGVVLSLRERLFRISLWVRREESAKEVIKNIGVCFRNICKIPTAIHVVYQLHANALKRHLDNDFIMSV